MHPHDSIPGQWNATWLEAGEKNISAEQMALRGRWLSESALGRIYIQRIQSIWNKPRYTLPMLFGWAGENSAVVLVWRLKQPVCVEVALVHIRGSLSVDSSQLKDVHVCVFFFCCFFLLEVSPFCQFCLSQNNSSDMSSRGRPRDIWARVYSIAILSNAVRQNSDVLKMLFIDNWRKRDSCAEQGSNGSCWLVYTHTRLRVWNWDCF